MPYTRREFLKASMISAVSTGFVLTAARIGVAQKPTRGNVTTTVQRRLDLPPEAQGNPVTFFRPETFNPYVGDIFTAPNALGQTVELELTKVTVYKPKNALRYTNRISGTESFGLTFKASAELPAFTSIHRVSHPALGDFDLFLTRRTSDSGDLFYEAVINHII